MLQQKVIVSQADLVDIHIYNPTKDEWEHPDADAPLDHPFHLTTTNHSGAENGMTNTLTGEKVAYKPITTLTDFLWVAKHDISASEFDKNHRSAKNFIRSNVICVDVDNDAPSPKHEYWDDESKWFYLDDFARFFAPYNYILRTSTNHLKPKEIKNKKTGEVLRVRKPRPKYHAFFPIGDFRGIDDYKLLREILTWNANMGHARSRVDTNVGAYNQMFGSVNTQVYYNKGERIDAMLVSGSVRDAFNADIGSNNGKSKYITSGKVGKGETDSDAISERDAKWVRTWDYRNIVEPTMLDEFYPTLTKSYDGYFMARCELHTPDNNPSLQVFHTGGFNCFGCGEKGLSPLQYVSKRDGKPVGKVRKEWCEEHHLDHNEYLMDKSCWEDDIELEGYVPITNLEHMYIPHDAYKTLKALNDEYAVLAVEGDVVLLKHGKTSYHQDFLGGHKTQIFQSMPKFKDAFNNHYVSCKYKGEMKKIETKDDDGNVIETTYERQWKPTIKTLGEVWLGWHKRREYDRGTFHPSDTRAVYKDERVWDYFDDWESATWQNNWIGTDEVRGLKRFLDVDKFSQYTSVEQAKEACSLYLDHIENILCGNYKGRHKELLHEYILKWMASCVSKHLDDRCTVALVLIDKGGTGKGMFSQFFGQLFGAFFYHLMSANRLGNTFNMLMKDRLLVFVDEAVWGGEKSQTGLVKAMQTENTMTIEMKHMNAFVANNHRRFIYASNSEWVVAKEIGGRRFQVIDVKDKKMGKKKYLEIKHQWDNGGKEGFYYYLTSPEMQEAIHDYDFEDGMIETKGSMQQIMETQPELGWWYELLVEGGHMEKGMDTGSWSIRAWNENTPNVFTDRTDAIFQSYVHHLDTMGIRHKGRKGNLNTKLQKLHKEKVLKFDGANRDYSNKGAGKTEWQFESLSDARKRWDAKWNNGEDSFGLTKPYRFDE